MPYLSQQQLQRMNVGPYSRDGATVPDSDMDNVPCWAWALAGEFVAASDPFSAASVYEHAFVFDTGRNPTATNDGYLHQITEIWPDTGVAVSALVGYAPDALDGHMQSQQACRMALMKIAAITNGLTVLGEGTDHDYTIHLRSTSWYGWDHFAVGIRMPPGGEPVNYVQTVPGVPLRYRCNAVWDEGMPETVIGVDGLLTTHIGTLDRIP